MKIERREGYELELLMAMVTGSLWRRATVVLKSQQPVMFIEAILTPGSLVDQK